MNESQNAPLFPKFNHVVAYDAFESRKITLRSETRHADVRMKNYPG